MGKTTFTYGRRRRDLGLVGCLALLLFSEQPAASQSRPLVRQWDEALGYYNPAALAPLGTGQIAGLWGREDHRHSYYLLLTDLPLELLGGRHIVGAQLLHHQQDLWEHSTFSLRGSACLPLSEGKRLQLGMEGTLHRLTFDGKKALEEGITNSELPTTKSEGKALGLSLGLQYYGERLYAGIAVTDLFGVHTRIGERYTAQLPPRYSATLSYHIGSDVAWAFVPAIWGSYSQDEKWRSEVRGTLWYHARIALGSSYRPGEALGLHTRLRLGELSLGYQVERSTRSSSFYHELLLSYTLPHGRTKHTEPRYKSIRLL